MDTIKHHTLPRIPMGKIDITHERQEVSPFPAGDHEASIILLIDDMVGSWCFGCCQAHPGLPIGFLHGLVRGLSCKPNIYVSWFTPELRVRLAPLNRFKPSSKIFYWPIQGGTSFVDHLCYLCLVFVMLSRLFIAALWEKADLLALVYDV